MTSRYYVYSIYATVVSLYPSSGVAKILQLLFEVICYVLLKIKTSNTFSVHATKQAKSRLVAICRAYFTLGTKCLLAQNTKCRFMRRQYIKWNRQHKIYCRKPSYFRTHMRVTFIFLKLTVFTTRYHT